MADDFKEPHILNIGTNPFKLVKNLAGCLNATELGKISAEIDANVAKLFLLGETHFEFACALDRNNWRQRISRIYYGAYNARRAVSLKYDGSFATDISDHKKIDSIPTEIEDYETYRTILKNLREDRNLADYNHLAIESDLLITADEYEVHVEAFLGKSRTFLLARGVVL